MSPIKGSPQVWVVLSESGGICAPGKRTYILKRGVPNKGPLVIPFRLGSLIPKMCLNSDHVLVIVSTRACRLSSFARRGEEAASNDPSKVKR